MNFWRIKWIGCVAAMVALATPAVSREESRGWERLGTRSVKLHAERDVILVSSTKGDFRKIQLRVRDNGVFVNSLVVVYGSGADDRIPMAYHIPANGRSRVIDLRGGDRVIRRIELNYRSVRNHRGKATVHVYGLH
jgi:hypothetical protein